MRYLYLLLFVLLTGAAAFAGPYWDLSVSGTTYQEWNFTAGDLLSNPDNPDDNPYATGPVTGKISSSFVHPLPQAQDGTWVGSLIIFTVESLANTPNTGPDTFKQIYIDVGMRGNIEQASVKANGKSHGPSTTEQIATYTTGSVATEDLKDWIVVRLFFELAPNPTEEDICIGLSDSGETQELDFIHVSTICVPEPASLALLTIGGFALLRKRKSQRQHFNK